MSGSFHDTFKTGHSCFGGHITRVEPPIWEINNVTPLNAENLNKMSSAIASLIDADDVVEAVLRKLSVKPVLKHQCTNCLAVLELDINKRIFHCPYCNAVYAISEG